MKHILCLRECHYPFITRMLVLLLLFISILHIGYSQDLRLKIKDPEEVTVCLSSETELAIFNLSTNDISNLSLKLKLPNGFEYLVGSVTGATESNINQLSAPEFSIAKLLGRDSIKIKVQLKTICELYQLINTKDTLKEPFLNKWIVQTLTETDSISSQQSLKIVAPYLGIDNLFDTSTVTGSSFQRKIIIRNNGLGSLTQFTFEDQHGSLEIGSTSGTLINQTGNLLRLYFNETDFLKIGNRDSLFDRDEFITVTENIQQTSCEVEDIRSFLFAYWGCELDTCQIDTITSQIHFVERGERAKFKFSKESPYPSCICSDKGTPQCLVIENIGNQTAENIVITLWAIEPIPEKPYNYYGILRGSVFATGDATIVDIRDSIHVEPTPDSCKSDQGYSIFILKLSDLAPGAEVKIRFNYMTCLVCAGAGNLTWKYDYSFNSKCVLGSTVNGYLIPADMINPNIMSTRNDIKDASGLLEDGKTYTVQNYITLSKKIDNQYLIVEYVIPCPLRLVDTTFLLNGKAPFYRKIDDADSSIHVFLIYAPPFIDTLYGEYTIKVDCNFLCRLNVNDISNTQFYSSCSDIHLYLSKLIGKICIDFRLTCPDREYDCGQCRANFTEFNVRCTNIPARRDTIYSYLDGSAEAYRKNYGGADPDDDRFLNLGTLDTAQTARKTFITGDTLVNDIRTAVVIDDDRYYYDSIVFMVTPLPLMGFDTIYSEIEIKDISTNKTYSCIYPISAEYIVRKEVPTCTELIVSRIQFGSGIIVPFTPEQLNLYGANIPSDFKFEVGDSINAKIYCRIYNFIGDKIQPIKLTYRAFFIDRLHIKPDPFSCMEIADTIFQATLRIKFTHEKDTLLICKSGFELFSTTIRGSKQLENLFHREFRKFYSLDSLKISTSNPNLFTNLIVDSIRIDYLYETDSSSLLIKSQTYPAYLLNNNWQIDPNLLRDNKFDESYTIIITPFGHLIDCAKFRTSLNMIFSSYYINGNDGTIFLDPTTSNTLTNTLLLSNANRVILFNGNDQLTIPPIIYSSTDKINWSGFLSKLQLPGGFQFEILSKNNSISNFKIQSTPDAEIIKLDSLNYLVKNLTSMKNYQFNFSAEHSYCQTDTILIVSRWLCDGDSSNIQDQCNLDTFPLFILTDVPFLQLDRIQESEESILCDTLPEIKLEIYNADKGTAFGVYLDVFIPPGTTLISPDLLYSYPKGTPYQILPTPKSLGSNRYRWKFEDFILSIRQDGLPGVVQAPKNSIQLKLKLITSCNAVVNSYPRFIINGRNHCDDPTNSEEQPGKLIQIKGLSSRGSFSINMQNQDIMDCAEETIIKLTILKNSASIMKDSLKIILPEGLHYKLNSIVNIKNMTEKDPGIFNESGNESLYFGLLDSLPVNDSIVFTMKVTGLKNILCSEQMIMALTYVRDSTECSATQSFCDVFIESGADEIVINQKTGSFNLDSFHIFRNKDSLNYDLKFKYQLKDLGLFSDSIICIGLYEDLNSNQQLEGTDPLIDTFCIDISKITADGTYPFENIIDKSKLKSCNYLLASLSSNCICDLDTLAVRLNLTQLYHFKDSSCAGSTFNLGIASDSTKKYKWTEGSVPCDTCSSIVVIINSTGGRDTLLNFTLLEIDKNGCAAEYKYQIQITKPDAGTDKTVNCIELPGGSAIMSATGKGIWSTLPGNPGTAVINTPTLARTAIISFSVAGIYNFIWIDDSGCKDTVSVFVTSKPNAGSDATICSELPGGTVTLSAAGIGTWSSQIGNPGVSIITNPNLSTTTVTSFTFKGIYHYIWMNANGCNDTVSVVVNLNPDGKDSLIVSCPGELINIDAGTRIKYLWKGDSINDPLSYQQKILNDKDQTIYLSFKDSLNCPGEDTFYIHPLIDTTKIYLYRDSMFVQSGDTSILPIGGSVIYCIIGGKVVRWEPNKALDCDDCPCVKITPEENTRYSVTVNDSFDCPHVFLFTVILAPINCDTTNVFLPNAFSPNNDKSNDFLFVRCQFLDSEKKIPVINKIHLGIYNRWGEKVFESFDIDYGWDGTFKGELLPPDVYGYFLEAECIGGKKYFKKGNVSLLK